MALQEYLPSTQFRVIGSSILVSLGLVWGTYTITRPPTTPSSGLVALRTTSDAQKTSWQKALDDIQTQQASHLPQAPDQHMVDSLLNAAKTDNITDSVGRSLLVNVTNARAQGLGADEPTQNQLVAAAIGQLQSVAAPSKRYTLGDLSVVPDSKEAVHAYANAIAKALSAHPRASMAETLTILGNKINNQSDQLAQFPSIAKAYRSLANDFLHIPVPQPLAAYHLVIVNDYLQMADSYAHMQTIGSDPLRGLAGLQIYNKVAADVQGMFINIAQIFAKDGILFTKGEPGALLGSMLSEQ